MIDEIISIIALLYSYLINNLKLTAYKGIDIFIILWDAMFIEVEFM